MAKKKKKKVTVMRYVKVTKTVVKKGSQTSTKKTASKIIGSFAGIKFNVKTDKDGFLNVMTFKDATHSVSGEWEEHRIIGRKFPKREFIGAGTRQFTMTIVVDATLGHSPHSVMAKLNKFCETGQYDELNIGAHKIGRKWTLDGMSEAYDLVYHNGQLIRATLDLTLGGYD